MVNQSQVQKAEPFKAMHDGREILVLPNASDVGSAKMVVEAGAVGLNIEGWRI